MHQQLNIFDCDFSRGRGKAETSKLADAKVTPHKPSKKHMILEMLEGAEYGLTADEAAEMLEQRETLIRPRFSDLLREGKIDFVRTPSGDVITRKNKYGNDCEVYKINKEQI